METFFKCRKCRTVILTYPENTVLSVHGTLVDLKCTSNSVKVEFIDTSVEADRLQCSLKHQEVIYISEVTLPQWITDCIDKGDWTRGKLTCPGCTARLGSFDFVTGFHCTCQSSVVPAVHLVRSKIDYSSCTSPLAENPVL